MVDYAFSRSDEQWRELLDPNQYAILREAATERAWTGAQPDEQRNAAYSCGACGATLFTD